MGGGIGRRSKSLSFFSFLESWRLPWVFFFRFFFVVLELIGYCIYSSEMDGFLKILHVLRE